MNGNKKINNLKRLVVIISIAILVVAVVLVMSIYNNKFGSDSGIKGGRKTVTTQSTEEIIFEEGDKTVKISDNKNIIIKADSLKDNKEVKTDSNNNIAYKTNEKNSNYKKATIVGKDKDSNVVLAEKELGTEVSASTYEEETVIIETKYIETLEPAVYTLTIFYKDENGNDKQVTITFTVEEDWPETTEPITLPTTETPTSGETKTVTVTKTRVTRTIPPTSGTITVTQPPKNYTVITSGASGYPNSESDVEWAIFNAINAKRTNKLKMAKELRDFAEGNASKAVNSFKASIGTGCSSYDNSKCRCDIDSGKYDNVSYCSNTYRNVDHAVSKLLETNVGILDEDYEYIGVGVVYDNDDHYSWVVTVD
jgi:uncharacterized protein YkwD